MAPLAYIFISTIIIAILDQRDYKPGFLASTFYSRIAYAFHEGESAICEWDYSWLDWNRCFPRKPLVCVLMNQPAISLNENSYTCAPSKLPK
jgi:hypothetical protein